MTTYTTVQMSNTAPGGWHRVHLGGPGQYGGVSNNVCGLNRHAPGYGFSVGGGLSDPLATPCRGCLAVVHADPDPRVTGMFGHLFTLTHDHVDVVDLAPTSHAAPMVECTGCGHIGWRIPA